MSDKIRVLDVEWNGGARFLNSTDVISAGGGGGAFSNAIVNGCARIQQNSPATVSGSLQYAGDMWWVFSTGSGLAGVFTTGSTSGMSSGKVHVLTGYSVTSGQFSIGTEIDSLESKRFNGKTVVVGMRVYHNFGSSTDFEIVVTKADTQDVWTAESVLSTSSAKGVADGTFTDIYHSWTMGATDGNTGLSIRIRPTANLTLTSKNFYVGNAVCQEGSDMPTFAMRPFKQEYDLCNEMIEGSFLNGVAPAVATSEDTMQIGIATKASTTTNWLGFVQYRVYKKKLGTVTIYNPTNSNNQARNYSVGGDCSSTTVSASSVRGFRAYCQNNAAGGVGDQLGFNWQHKATWR